MIRKSYRLFLKLHELQTIRKCFLSLFTVAVIAFSYSETFAENVDPFRFIEEVKSKVEDPLPPLSEVIPGYTLPSAEVPSLIVADLASDREDEMPWGEAIGRIIRRKIMFAPRVLLRMPDIFTVRADAQQSGMPDKDVLRSLESAKIVGSRLGIKNSLTGNVKIHGSTYEMNLELRRLPSGQPYKTFRYTGAVSELPRTFTALTVDVYKTLGVSLDEKSRNYISKETPANFEQLKLFAEVLQDLKGKSGQEAREIAKTIISRHIDTQAAVALYVYYMEPDKNLMTYLGQLEGIADKFPADVGFELMVAKYMGYKDTTVLKLRKINKFQKIIRENPLDPNAMIAYGDFLASSGYTLAALTVCMETLKRWPDQYRAWWNMAYAVMEYIGQARGTKFWNDVPEKAKRMFYPLKDLADKAVNKSLEYNVDNENLWILKMQTIGGYSPELIECFHRAMKLAPHNQYVYSTALNYSLPQWGGSIEAQAQIWDLAVKNNPGAPWLEEVRKNYMKEPPSNDK